ncbi:MAG: type II toxin-antitoxin system mRNA interferase toxin, RelE/StbE family [Nitrospirae bacterium]|nr:type II toxin-antitoxin system mRNA interferase toxin, RelE/StbE family [Nitrospirota bacterium]
MIRSFKHKGIERFFHDGDKAGINPDHAGRLARILDRLDASLSPHDMDLPGFKLHELKGRERGVWAVHISGNWRVVFRFEGNDAAQVDYLDYH